MFTIDIPEYVPVPTWLIIASLLYLLYLAFFRRLWERFWNPCRVPPDGFIYLMWRADGLHKIGRTNDLKERRESLSRQYQQPVKLIASWAVPNAQRYEAKALAITRHFALDNTELRAMSRKDILAFIFVFSLICERMAKPGKLETI